MENILAAILQLSREEKLRIYTALENDLNGFEEKNVDNHLSDEEWGVMDEKMEEGEEGIQSANHEELMRWLAERKG